MTIYGLSETGVEKINQRMASVARVIYTELCV